MGRRQRHERPSDPEVHQRRQVRHADRPRRQESRQRRHREPQSARRHLRARGDERARRGGRLRQPANHRLRCRHRPVQADVGCVRQCADATPRRIRRCPMPTRKAPSQFVQPVHAARVSKDGLVYVSDRGGKRVQVFRLDGTYVTQVFIGRECKAPECGNGSTAASTAFSTDADQRYLFVGNRSQAKVMVFERRGLQLLGSFGEWGSAPGQFGTLHHMASDSKGNLYVTEVTPLRPENRRVQKLSVRRQGRLKAAPRIGCGVRLQAARVSFFRVCVRLRRLPGRCGRPQSDTGRGRRLDSRPAHRGAAASPRARRVDRVQGRTHRIGVERTGGDRQQPRAGDLGVAPSAWRRSRRPAVHSDRTAARLSIQRRASRERPRAHQTIRSTRCSRRIAPGSKGGQRSRPSRGTRSSARAASSRACCAARRTRRRRTSASPTPASCSSR